MHIVENTAQVIIVALCAQLLMQCLFIWKRNTHLNKPPEPVTDRTRINSLLDLTGITVGLENQTFEIPPNPLKLNLDLVCCFEFITSIENFLSDCDCLCACL